MPSLGSLAEQLRQATGFADTLLDIDSLSDDPLDVLQPNQDADAVTLRRYRLAVQVVCALAAAAIMTHVAFDHPLASYILLGLLGLSPRTAWECAGRLFGQAVDYLALERHVKQLRNADRRLRIRQLGRSAETEWRSHIDTGRVFRIALRVVRLVDGRTDRGGHGRTRVRLPQDASDFCGKTADLGIHVV